MSRLLRSGRLLNAKKHIINFVSSAKDDKAFLMHLVEINKAHIVMLTENGIIKEKIGKKILSTLSTTYEKIHLSDDIDDAYVAIEEEVVKNIGVEIGGNLNLAKSRNDQVATAIRMNLREELLFLIKVIIEFQENLLSKSRKNLKILMTGYTHLQPAQPITFAHYLTAQFDVLQRSMNRLKESYTRIDLCPMGSGALATTSFTINRQRMSELLGFSGILENSIDAVGTRDFVLEIIAIMSILGVGITRFVEDLIIWNTIEFGIIKLPDSFTFTSSIMPQKKNPDILEVIRSKMSSIIGEFVSCAVILKGLPSVYNLDFQEITPKLWRVLKSSRECLSMLSDILENLEVKSNLLQKSSLGFITATELANILVRNHDIPFRIAHNIIGVMIRTLIENGKLLEDITPGLLENIAKKTANINLKIKSEEINQAINPTMVVESYNIVGGPAKKQVKLMIISREENIEKSKDWVKRNQGTIKQSKLFLNSTINLILQSNT